LNKLTNFQKAKLLNQIYKKAKMFKGDPIEDKHYTYDLLKTMVGKINLEPKEYETAIKNVCIYLGI
jgi:hypothetical protein